MKMDNSSILVLSLLVLAEVADISFSSPIIPQRSLRDIVNKRRQLSYIKSLLQELDEKLEKLENPPTKQWDSNARNIPFQYESSGDWQAKKRSCAINIPGSDCDYSEISGTGKDQGFWNSRLVPGKRRRYLRDLN